MEIQVKKGTIKFDRDDYPLVEPYTWFIENTGYAVTNIPGIKTRQTRLYMQRLLMGDPPKGYLIKFLNGDRADCRRKNLEFQLRKHVRQSADDWKSMNMSHCRPINVDRDPVTNQWKKKSE